MPKTNLTSKQKQSTSLTLSIKFFLPSKKKKNSKKYSTRILCYFVQTYNFYLTDSKSKMQQQMNEEIKKLNKSQQISNYLMAN